MHAIACSELLPCPTPHIVVTRIGKIATAVVGRLHIGISRLEVFNMLVQIVAIPRMSGNAPSHEQKPRPLEVLVEVYLIRDQRKDYPSKDFQQFVLLAYESIIQLAALPLLPTTPTKQT